MNKDNYCYEYPRPALTVDVILFALVEGVLSTLLIQRKDDPFKDCWAFPGGFVDPDETGEKAALRELKEETFIEGVELEQLFTDSDLGRDPRGRTVSIVYYAFVKTNNITLKAGDDAKKAEWFSVSDMPKLAFDHSLLFKVSLKKLNDLLLFKVLGKELFPRIFGLKELSKVYQQVNSDSILIESVVSRLKAHSILKPSKEDEKRWEFDTDFYEKVKVNGFL